MKKIVVGIIILGTIGVIAATIIPATIVTYQDKTVSTALDELYDSVNLLKTKGDAEAPQILTGKKAIVKGTEITGTMANRGNLNWNPSSSATYTVPAGYYSGGTISSSNAYSKGVTDADNRANANSVNYKTGYNAGYNEGKYGKYNLASETKRGTYTLNTANNWGSDSITFNFSGNVAGVRSFSQTAASAYCYLVSISISGSTVTLTFAHAHGINSSTNTVELTVWYYY